MNRRGFIASLFAPLVAKWLPKLPVPAIETQPINAIAVNTTSTAWLVYQPSDASLYGLRYHQILTGSGNYMGLSRSPRENAIITNIGVPQPPRWHFQRIREPGSFQRYIEAEAKLDA